MFRPASRLIARSSAVRALPRVAPARRFLSTAPPSQKSRSWKSLSARVGIAGAAIYLYNTTEVFAEEPSQVVYSLPETDKETEQLPTIEALAQERQQRKAEAAAVAAAAQNKDAVAQDTVGAGGVEDLEEEAGQQGAFNPETGEINWDCPCLGGMATGPCGEQFKAAFSCFVFSTEEPKGMDCIDKFKEMQGCFREYPEVYGKELEGDDDEETVVGEEDLAGLPATQESAPSEEAGHARPPPSQRQETERVKAASQPVNKVEKEVLSESESLVPKAAHDEREANERKQ